VQAGAERRQKEAEEQRRLAAKKEAETRRRKAAHDRAAEAERHRLARAAVAAAVKTAAQHLLEGSTANAANALTALRETPFYPLVSKDVGGIHTFVEQIAVMPAMVLASFETDKGKEVGVEFSDGSAKTLLVVGVFQDRVKARQRFPQGYAEQDFTVADLSPGEKWKRLGQSQGPDVAAMRGLLAAQGGYWDKAATHFAQVHNPIGQVLSGIAAERVAEASARQAFSRLLRLAGITVEAKNTEQVLKSIREAAYDPEQAGRIRTAVAEFNSTFDETETAKSCAAVLQQLLAANAPPAPPAAAPLVVAEENAGTKGQPQPD